MRIAILPSVLIAALTAAAPAFADDAATIKRLSQQFSDASASGDAAVLGRLLDDRAVFINEGGDIATRKDIVSSAGPAPKGVHNTLTQTNFKVVLYGATAVTSFDDVLVGVAHGQALHAKFRSTEVWLKEGADWKMISSQTLALQDDPPAVALPAQTLDEYAGTYGAGDLTFQIARAGDGLTGSVGGAKPFVIKAELRDVLFTPGVPRVRRLIQRDAAGKVTGFISRHEGHDLLFRRVG
jgi:hypothetical protein